MTAFGTLRSWIKPARKVNLSSFVTVVFVGTFVLPWCVFAWLTLAGRAQELEKAEQTLQAVATAYAEHAATVTRLGITLPTETVRADPARADEIERGEEQMAAFRRALDIPGVELSLRTVPMPNTVSNDAIAPATAADPARTRHENGAITAEVVHSAAQIAAVASMSEDVALQDWSDRTFVQIVALMLRSLFVAGIGIFFVSQLRAKEKLQAELVIAREAAEIASRAKSDLLASTSHELRTPLNAIIGFSELIKVEMFGPLSKRYRDYAGDIFHSGTHLLGLINEILDLSKLEAGQLKLYEEDVDLSAVVRDSVRLVETQAAQSNIVLSGTVPDELPLIRADDRRLRQILINLLSNAVKFTPEGGRVQVAVSRRNGVFALQVSDTGIGMPPELIAKALEPFGQIDSKISRKHQGTGLGLPIAKQLAELHGGSLTITSATNAGTTVLVTLPAERAVAKPVPALTTVRVAG